MRIGNLEIRFSVWALGIIRNGETFFIQLRRGGLFCRRWKEAV